MSKKLKRELLAEDHLLEHSRWIAERFERMNEQLMTLSGTFIGFLAIELGLLAQIPRVKIHTHHWTYWLGFIALSAIAMSILLFFATLISKEFKLPKLEDFQDAYELDADNMQFEPLRMMISANERDRNIQKSLEEENSHLNRFYTLALYLGGTAQLLVVALIFMIWTVG